MLLDDITEWTGCDTREASEPTPPPMEAIDPILLRVIAIARHDSLRSAYPAESGDRLIARLFGILPSAPLADKRLEAVRRFCILVRHRDARAQTLRDKLIALGFSKARCQRIEAIVLTGEA